MNLFVYIIIIILDYFLVDYSCFLYKALESRVRISNNFNFQVRKPNWFVDIHNIWFGFGPGDELVAGKMIQVTSDAEDPTAAFLISHLTANNNSIADPKLRGISRDTDGMLDPRLAAGSPAWGGVSDEIKSATFENTDMLEKVSYRGAFASNNWAKISDNKYPSLKFFAPTVIDCEYAENDIKKQKNNIRTVILKRFFITDKP